MSNSFSLLQKKIELLFTQCMQQSVSTIKQQTFTIRFKMNNQNEEVFPNPANIFRKQEESAKQEEFNPSEPSICIPRVFKSITRKDIFGVIEKLELGAVDRIDMVSKVNERGECYNKVFIHFKVWNKKTPTAQATREKLLKGEEIKIVYKEPWFWKCTASRVEKPAFRDYSAPPPRIDLGGCKSLCATKDATKDDVE